MRNRRKKQSAQGIKKEEKVISPFSSIVLKEKTDEDKKRKEVRKESPAKPSDIVQGYNPSLSFRDILESFERTGNPYSMKKSTQQTSDREDFASILDKWENRGKKEKKSGDGKKSEYKAERSFSDILDEFEGRKRVNTGKEKKAGIEEKEEEVIRNSVEPVSFFKKEQDDEKRSSNASWSIYGSNDSFVRIREEKNCNDEVKASEKTEQKKVSAPYKPEKDFSEILSSYYGEKKKADKTEDSEMKKEKARSPKLKNEEKKDKVKTFDEILKEKGDLELKKESLTMSQLRVMKPMSSLDLHGMGYEEAKKEINSFLSQSFESEVRKISIITGKGLHSQDGQPVLKNLCLEILDSSAFVSERMNAPYSFGGDGVIWVILKKKEH